MTGLTRALPEWVTTTRWSPRVGPGSVAVVLLALAGCWWVGGVVGVVVWAVVATTWLLFPPIVPVAVAQFGLIVLFPNGVAATTLLFAELPVLLLLGTDIVEQAEAWLAGIVLLGLSAVGAGVVLAIGDDLLVEVTLGIVGAGGIASYLLHRYLLLDLGLIESVENN